MTRQVEEMKTLITTMARTISRMEAEQQEQRALLNTLLVATSTASPDSPPVTSTAAQPEPTAMPNGKPPITCAEGERNQSRPKSYASSLKTQSQNKLEKRKTSYDVKSQNDVRRSIPENSDEGIPRVLVIHDSTFNNIDPQRLGQSFDLKIATNKASTIDRIANVAKEASQKLDPAPDSVVIHVGLNDIKTKEADECGRQLAQATQEVRNVFPNSSIVCSHTLPTRDEKLDTKRVLFNAHVYSELSKCQAKNISYISHENLSLNRHLKDDFHPNAYGSASIAKNLGRHLRGMFWQRPKRRQNVRAGTRDYPHDPRSWKQEGPNRHRHHRFNRNSDSRSAAVKSFLPPPHRPVPDHWLSAPVPYGFPPFHRGGPVRSPPGPGWERQHRGPVSHASPAAAYPFYSPLPPWLY
jgi:lysophospholipase L1-like esterase